MVKFDPDMMFFCLMMKIAAGVVTIYLKTVLCQKKEVLCCWVSLMRSDWTGLWRFDVLFWLVECQLDLDVYADRVRAIEALVGKRVQIGEANCSQAFTDDLPCGVNCFTEDGFEAQGPCFRLEKSGSVSPFSGVRVRSALVNPVFDYLTNSIAE
ncbi:hypothetical protein BpHYR1_004023 [Brachionus plicatilis]|uniref:Uncharacterized protein n=1 Tax=Brachionus plicatilis TaxID=10195 RepID=A0A3M7P245_BRAPC|nr:hypothetical protein BpHYR1_004023 [Brachionus plicatilis]